MYNKLLYLIGLMLTAFTLVVFIGCGGSESGIEDEEEVVAIELTAHDDGEMSGDGTITIDVVQSTCVTEEEETTEETREEEPGGETPSEEEENANVEAVTAEPFFDTGATAKFYYVFYCPTCPPGADETYIFDRYTVEYIPLKSPSGSGGYFYPPELVNLDKPILSQIVLSKDFTEAERTIFLIPIHTKQEYVKKMIEAGGYDSNRAIPFFGLYSIRVTFHGRNRVGGSLTVTSTLELSFGNYNACE